MTTVSVIIRTLNEQKHLRELLDAIRRQQSSKFDIEVVIIDSGSTDSTLDIARASNARITTIEQKRFTFGRSLNEGCRFSTGEVLVFVSGHCVPCANYWIDQLCTPILDGRVDYTYGRQIGRDTTKFSESQLFEKYFPNATLIPTNDFFVNNANSAIARRVWQEFLFDENIMALEDMELAKRITARGGAIGYVSEAEVFHIHDERWDQVMRRYEREAIALKEIMPVAGLSLLATVRYFFAGVFFDGRESIRRNCFLTEIQSIIRFRWAQYFGAYKGGRWHKKMYRKQREEYFYPINRKK